MELTIEQEQIVNCKLNRGDTLKIIAGAGTGKTSTLIEYSKARPNHRMLYLCFNKSVQVEASGKFPSNVECRTGHSLAWSGFGARYRHKLVPGLKPFIVKSAMRLDSYEITQASIDTLLNFLQSAEAEIKSRHVPQKALLLTGATKPAIVKNAKAIWEAMIDIEDSRIGMLHDGYLKLWQLSNPDLNYDVILLDEAQDTNPTLASVFFSQDRAIKVLVGDAHQQIYSFRGSRNFMQGIEATQTFMLAKSFRFHSGIADIANMILGILKNEKELKIIGVAKESDCLGNKKTFIARTNAGIFDGAAGYLGEKKIAYVGGAKNYKFNMIHDVYRLSVRKTAEIKDKYISSFGTYQVLVEYAKAVEDKELLGITRLVKIYGAEIPGLIDQIFELEVEESEADVTFVTAHKCKGLEWNRVELVDDFQDYYQENTFVTSEMIDPDEINLAYVAATRAKQELKYGVVFGNFIRHAKELSLCA